jgi:hypothetical protein
MERHHQHNLHTRQHGMGAIPGDVQFQELPFCKVLSALISCQMTQNLMPPLGSLLNTWRPLVSGKPISTDEVCQHALAVMTMWLEMHSGSMQSMVRGFHLLESSMSCAQSAQCVCQH